MPVCRAGACAPIVLVLAAEAGATTDPAVGLDKPSSVDPAAFAGARPTPMAVIPPTIPMLPSVLGPRALVVEKIVSVLVPPPFESGPASAGPSNAVVCAHGMGGAGKTILVSARSTSTGVRAGWGGVSTVLAQPPSQRHTP